MLRDVDFCDVDPVPGDGYNQAFDRQSLVGWAARRFRLVRVTVGVR
jgi:hypothetical protein